MLILVELPVRKKERKKGRAKQEGVWSLSMHRTQFHRTRVACFEGHCFQVCCSLVMQGGGGLFTHLLPLVSGLARARALPPNPGPGMMFSFAPCFAPVLHRQCAGGCSEGMALRTLGNSALGVDESTAKILSQALNEWILLQSLKLFLNHVPY